MIDFVMSERCETTKVEVNNPTNGLALKELITVGSLLLVHNQTDDREMYAEYLRAKGFDVHEVGTTDEALPLTGGVDAVITGLLVAGSIDSIEFIRRVRSTWSSLPIVVVTACVYTNRMEQAERAGADVVLLKPCLPDTLLNEVNTALDGAKVRLVSPQARRMFDDRRFDLRGGRRDGDWFHRAS